MLEAREGLTFLDIIVRQAEHRGVPLVLMNSFATSEDTMRYLAEHHPDADVREFLQNKEPKLLVDDLTPADWPDDQELEWAPPGHGDLYVALQGSGMLRTLLDRGYEAAFVSLAHTEGDIDTTVRAAGEIFRELRA